MDSQPLSAGALLLQYRLVRKLGSPSSAVWLAEDPKSGRNVAVKILSRFAPQERPALEALLREGRQAAALYHPAMPVILELNATSDCYFMVMEMIEGDSLAHLLGSGPLDRTRFFRLAFPVVEAVAYLHGRGIPHGAISSDNVIVSRVGTVKVVGLGLRNIVRRADARAGLPDDVRAVSFMAPEQVAGKPADDKADIFSLGALFYEMLTGRLPFSGATPADVAAKVTSEQPASPRSLNPAVDSAALNLTGRCLFKDPAKRFPSSKALLEEMKKAEPSLARAVASPVRPQAEAQAAPQPAAPPERPKPAAREGLVLIADIADYGSLEREDHGRALRIASRMQQVVGEAVYLYDGNVTESLGPRMVAELPTHRKALDAATRARADLAEWNRKSPEPERVEPRMVLHSGQIIPSDRGIGGPAVDLAVSVIESIRPLQLLVSEPALAGARIEGIAPVAGTLAGVTFHDFSSGASIAPPAVAVAAAVAAAPAYPVREKERARGSGIRRLMPAIIAAAVVAVAVSFGAWWHQRSAEIPPAVGVRPVAGRAAARQPPIRARIAVEPFAFGSADAMANERANRIRLASIEILRTIRPVQIVDGAAAEVRFGARVRDGAAGPELVPTVSSEDAGTIPLRSGSLESATATYVAMILRQVGLPAERLVLPSERAFDSFASAISAFSASKGAGSPEATGHIRASLAADANFLPAQRLAMQIFASEGNTRGAVVAGKQVIELDPADTEALRTVAKWEIREADAVSALRHFQQILDHEPFDADALEAIGQYSLSVGGDAAFRRALVRLSGAKPVRPRPIHEPDLLVYEGKIEQAVPAYYELERVDSSNPALALKIGRLAVLRHSMDMAELELEKLRRLDPEYGYHVLKAFVSAEKKQRRNANAEIQIAIRNARWNDHPYTDAAQVAAILNDTRGVIDSLKKAVERGEATGNYILHNPLFRYLEKDRRYLSVRSALQAKMDEISDQLARSRL